MKLAIINDLNKSQYKGGTEYYADFLTRVGNDKGFETKQVNTELKKNLSDVDICVVLNIAHFPEEDVRWMMENKKYIKVEMDYGFCASRNAKCTFSKCPHAEDGKCYSPKFLFYKEVLEKAEIIVFLNPHQREFYRNFFGEIVNNSMICMSFYEYPEKFVNEKRFRIPNSYFFSARLYSEKGVDNIIRFAVENPHLNIFVLGFGDPYYVNKILNIRNIVYLGDLPESRETMNGYYNMFENFLSFPIWADTGPIKVVEAELCGMNLVINDNNKIRTNGWKDIKELREMINDARERLFKKVKEIYEQ
jgi:glycosyltransferase involved in cell wall biosynthesis